GFAHRRGEGAGSARAPAIDATPGAGTRTGVAHSGTGGLAVRPDRRSRGARACWLSMTAHSRAHASPPRALPPTNVAVGCSAWRVSLNILPPLLRSAYASFRLDAATAKRAIASSKIK